MKRFIQYFYFFRQVNIVQFFYLNYFCKNVIRKDKSKIIPYKHAVIELDKDSKIYLENGDIEAGCDRLKKSKAETLICLKKGARWNSGGGCKISYGCTIHLLPNSVFESKYFTINCNSVIVVSKNVTLGDDVMISRNVVIYDSDFHQILDEKKRVMNPSKPVKIGDHVWLGVNVTILKGAEIGSGCVIGARTLVNGTVEAHCIYQEQREKTERTNYRCWNRKHPEEVGDYKE